MQLAHRDPDRSRCGVGTPPRAVGVLPWPAWLRARAAPCLRGSTGAVGSRCSAWPWWSSSASARCSASAATAPRTRRPSRPARRRSPARPRRYPPPSPRRRATRGRAARATAARAGRAGARRRRPPRPHPGAARPDGPCADNDVYITPTIAAPIGGADVRSCSTCRPRSDRVHVAGVAGDRDDEHRLAVTTRSGSSDQCPDAVPTQDVIVRLASVTQVPVVWRRASLRRGLLRADRVGAARLLPRGRRRARGREDRRAVRARGPGARDRHRDRRPPRGQARQGLVARP